MLPKQQDAWQRLRRVHARTASVGAQRPGHLDDRQAVERVGQPESGCGVEGELDLRGERVVGVCQHRHVHQVRRMHQQLELDPGDIERATREPRSEHGHLRHRRRRTKTKAPLGAAIDRLGAPRPGNRPPARHDHFQVEREEIPMR